MIDQTNMYFVFNHEDFEASLASPFYKCHKIINDTTILVEEFKPKVFLNRPIQIGVSILERSKEIMYKYFFGELKERFNDRLTALYTDTDSFIFEIKTKNFDKDLRKLSKSMDTSNFPSSHPLFSTKNASALGFFKSETSNERIHVMTSLRSKVYHIVKGDDFKYESKLKGVNRDAVKQLKLISYLKSLLLRNRQFSTFKKINSNNHHLTFTKITKQSLFSYEDKVILLNCGLHTRKVGAALTNEKCTCAFSRLDKRC